MALQTVTEDIFHIRSTMFHPAKFKLQHALHHSPCLPCVCQFVIIKIKMYTVTNTYIFSFGMNTQCGMIYQILYNFEADAYDKQVSHRDVGTYLVFDCVQLSSSVLQGNYYYYFCCGYKTIIKCILFLFHPILLFFK